MRKLHLFLLITIIGILIASKMYDVSIGDTQGFSIKNIILYPSLLVLALVNLGRLGATIRALPALWPLLFILGLAATSFFYARLMAHGVRIDQFSILVTYKNHLLDPFLIYAAGFIIAKRIPEEQKPLYITTIAFALLNIVAMSVFVTGFNPFGVSVVSHSGTRFASFGGMANQGAYSLAILIPLLYYLYDRASNNFAKYSYVFFIFACLAGIGLTGSRGGYLLIIIEFLMLMQLTGRYAFFSMIAAGGVAAMIVYAAAFNLEFLISALSRLELLSGIEKITDFQKRADFSALDQVSAGRTWIWKGIYEVMANDPLALVLGKGWGTYRPHIKEVLGIDPAAHNVFLLYLLELGITGLVLLCLAGYQYLRFIRNNLRNQDRLLYHCVTVMLVVVIWSFMLSAPVNLYKIWGLLFGVLAGYIAGSRTNGGEKPVVSGPARTSVPLSDSDGIIRRRNLGE